MQPAKQLTIMVVILCHKRVWKLLLYLGYIFTISHVVTFVIVNSLH